MERKRTLTNQGWATKVDYDAAERTFLSAKAEVDVAKAQLHAAEDQLSYTKLLADAPGVVDLKERRGRRGGTGRRRQSSRSRTMTGPMLYLTCLPASCARSPLTP